MANGYSVMRSPKAAMKASHKQTAMREVGGTNNMARHLYGGPDGTDTNRAFAVIALDDVPNYVPATTSYGYAPAHSNTTVAGSRRSDGYVIHHEESFDIDPVIMAAYVRRANELGISLYAYMVRMGYVD